MASRTVPRPRAHFIRVFHEALRAVAPSADAAVVARAVRASAEQRRAWTSRAIEETRAVVARSRAILRRRSPPQPLSGGAGDAFHEAIRARLAARTLPRIDASASAEDGSGTRRCVCCDRSIARWQPEYEPTLARSCTRTASASWCGSMDDDFLRTTIRALVAGRTLPRVDGRAWAGKGSGIHTCACCGEPIRSTDQEFEPRAVTGLHAHGPCFTVWLAESIGLRFAEGRPSGPQRPTDFN